MQIEVQDRCEAVLRDGKGNVIGYWIPAANGTVEHETTGLSIDQRHFVAECESLRKQVAELQQTIARHEEEIDILSQILKSYLVGDTRYGEEGKSFERFMQELEQNAK